MGEWWRPKSLITRGYCKHIYFISLSKHPLKIRSPPSVHLLPKYSCVYFYFYIDYTFLKTKNNSGAFLGHFVPSILYIWYILYCYNLENTHFTRMIFIRI